MPSLKTLDISFVLSDGTTIKLSETQNFTIDSFTSNILTATEKVLTPLVEAEGIQTNELKINSNVGIRADNTDKYKINLPLKTPAINDKPIVGSVNADGTFQLKWSKTTWHRDVFVEHFWVNYPWWNQLNSRDLKFADLTNIPQNMLPHDKYLGICEILPGGFFKIPTIDFSTSLNNINPLIITFRVKPKNLHLLVEKNASVKKEGDICSIAENNLLNNYICVNGNWKLITPTTVDGVTDTTIGKAFFGIFGIAGFSFDVIGGISNTAKLIPNGKYLGDRLPHLTISATGSGDKYKVPAEFLNLNIILKNNKIILKINDYLVSEFDQSFIIPPNLLGKINVNSLSLEEIGGVTDSLHFYVDLVKVTEITDFDDNEHFTAI